MNRPPPRPSTPEAKAAANLAIAEHVADRQSKHRIETLDEVVRRMNDQEQWVKGVVDGMARHHREVEIRNSERDQLAVATARAVGVDVKLVPPELARRSVPPPKQAEGSTAPAPVEQKPVLPKYQRLAAIIAVAECLREGFRLLEHLGVHFP